MINFRYHIVSLVAVFLALGLGILMGSTVIDQGLVERLESQTKTLGGNLDATRKENGTLQNRLSAWESFGDTTLGSFIKGKLSGRSVVVVAQDGVDPHLFDLFGDAFREAGATSAGRVTLSPKWSLKDDAAREQLGVALGLQAAAPGDMWPEAAGRLAGRLGQAKDISQQGDLLGSLRTGGFLAVDGAAPGPFPPVGTMVVVLAAGTREAMPPQSEFFMPFLRALNPGRKTLVAEPFNSAESLAERVRGDADLRLKLSTIDDVDITLGRISLVLGLRQVGAGGRHVHFGTRRSATELLPATLLR